MSTFDQKYVELNHSVELDDMLKHPLDLYWVRSDQKTHNHIILATDISVWSRCSHQEYKASCGCKSAWVPTGYRSFSPLCFESWNASRNFLKQTRDCPTWQELWRLLGFLIKLWNWNRLDQEQYQLHKLEFRLDTWKAGQSLVTFFTLEGGPVKHLSNLIPWILNTLTVKPNHSYIINQNDDNE